MLSELKKIKIESVRNLPNAEKRIEEINNCKNITELGYTFQTAINELSTRGIPVVLTEEDKEIIPNDDEKFDSIDSFIAVHKDAFLPVDSKILTPNDANVIEKSYFIVDDVKYEYEYRYQRDSVHFALNGEVDEIGEAGGSWDTFPYITLTPLKKIPIGKKGQYSLGDTFSEGSVELDEDSWILIPKGKKDELLKQNTNLRANVIEYDGEPKGYANALLSMLGYKYEEQSSHAALWQDMKDTEIARKFFNEKYSEHLGTRHYGTESQNIDDRWTSRNKVIAIIDKIRDESIISLDDTAPNIGTQLIDIICREIDGSTLLTEEDIKYIMEESTNNTGPSKIIFSKIDWNKPFFEIQQEVKSLIATWLMNIAKEATYSRKNMQETHSYIKDFIEDKETSKTDRKDVNQGIEEILEQNNIDFSKLDDVDFFAIRTTLEKGSELYQSLIENGYVIIYPAKLSELGVERTIKSDFSDRINKIDKNDPYRNEKVKNLEPIFKGEVAYFHKKEDEIACSEALIIDARSTEASAELLDLVTRYYSSMINYAKSLKDSKITENPTEIPNQMICHELENGIRLDGPFLEKDKSELLKSLEQLGFEFDLKELDVSKCYTPEYIESMGKPIWRVADFKNVKGCSLRQLNLTDGELRMEEIVDNAIKGGVTKFDEQEARNMDIEEVQKGEHTYEE